MPGYTLEDGKTLKNLLGAQDPDELEQLMPEKVAGRQVEMAIGLGPTGDFDLEHLKAIHRHLFQDAFEWAGHTRDERFRMSDGSVATEPIMRKPGGKDFEIGPRAIARIESTFERLEADEYLQGLDRGEFASKAADVLADLNTAHVFREGNGRTQRAFMTALAQQAGHEMRFDVVSRERMSQVSIASHERGDNTGFERMIGEIIDPDRVAALSQAQQFLDQHRQTLDWRDRYMATTEEGRDYTLTMVGRAGTNFMARSASEILVGRSSDLPEPLPQSGQSFTMTTAVQQRQTAEDAAPRERVYNKQGVDITGGDEPAQKQDSKAQKM